VNFGRSLLASFYRVCIRDLQYFHTQNQLIMKKKLVLTLLWFALISGLSMAQVPVSRSIYDEKSDFPIDYPLYRISEGEKNKFGFIDKKGQEIIACQFESAESFKGDSAFVKDDKTHKWGIINKFGILVMPYQFDSPFEWNKDGFKSSINEKQGYEDIGIACMNNKYGIINRQGKWLVPPQYNEGYRGFVFFNGYAAVIKDRKMGLINQKGEEILPFIYEHLGLFNDGLINMGIGNEDYRAGFVNLKNEIVIPLIYKYTLPFENGFATAVIMVKNEQTIPKNDAGTLTDNVADILSPPNQLDSVERYGVIDTTGKVIIPFQYASVEYANDGLFAAREAKMGGKCGFVNMQNQVVIPFQFDLMLNPFYNGAAIVTKTINGQPRYFYIDKTGKCVKGCP
jgi:WG containing repeat